MAILDLDPLFSGLEFAENRQRQNKINDLTKKLSEMAGMDVTQTPEFQQLQILDPNRANQMRTGELSKIQMMQAQMGLDDARTSQLFEDARALNNLVKSGAQQQAIQFADNRIANIANAGGSPIDTQEIRQLIARGELNAAGDLLDSVVQAGEESGYLIKPKKSEVAEVTAFNKFVKDANLNPDEVSRAARIKLGLDAREVGSSDMTLAQKSELRKLVKDMKSEQAQSVKFAELTGAARAKEIDKGFDKIDTINSKLANYDRAIQLIDEGAGVGKVNSLWPSIKAATIELENIKNQLGLDVISGASFGALSEGELNMALQTALPTNLPPKELKQWLIDKKEADTKLLNYVRSQIDHLDQGGTKASFMRMMERGQSQQSQPSNDQSNNVYEVDF